MCVLPGVQHTSVGRRLPAAGYAATECACRERGSRSCRSIDAARKLTSDDVLERLSWLMATRGVPERIRSDSGPEFTAKAMRAWLPKAGATTLLSGTPFRTPRQRRENHPLRCRTLVQRPGADRLLHPEANTQRGPGSGGKVSRTAQRRSTSFKAWLARITPHRACKVTSSVISSPSRFTPTLTVSPGSCLASSSIQLRTSVNFWPSHRTSRSPASTPP